MSTMINISPSCLLLFNCLTPSSTPARPQWSALWTNPHRAWLLSRLRATPCLMQESMHGATASGCLYILVLCDTLSTQKTISRKFHFEAIWSLIFVFAMALCYHGNRRASWVFPICVAICPPGDASGRRHGEMVKRASPVNKHGHKRQVFHIVCRSHDHMAKPAHWSPSSDYEHVVFC